MLLRLFVCLFVCYCYTKIVETDNYKKTKNIENLENGKSIDHEMFALNWGGKEIKGFEKKILNMRKVQITFSDS